MLAHQVPEGFNEASATGLFAEAFLPTMASVIPTGLYIAITMGVIFLSIKFFRKISGI